mmetsp:Transcript_115026/g.264202  ORF Transcript_115026/g.264202 Transcript_115026/m.264202 type:complete len:275 (-) Transcript_115026:247-1071(-)
MSMLLHSAKILTGNTGTAATYFSRCAVPESAVARLGLVAAHLIVGGVALLSVLRAFDLDYDIRMMRRQVEWQRDWITPAGLVAEVAFLILNVVAIVGAVVGAASKCTNVVPFAYGNCLIVASICLTAVQPTKVTYRRFLAHATCRVAPPAPPTAGARPEVPAWPRVGGWPWGAPETPDTELVVDPTVPPTAPCGDTDACPVCLQTYAAGEAVWVLNDCGHAIHAVCMREWARRLKVATCPLCRGQVDADAMPPVLCYCAKTWGRAGGAPAAPPL